MTCHSELQRDLADQPMVNTCVFVSFGHQQDQYLPCHPVLHLQVPRPQDYPKLLSFHCEIAWQLIDNKYLNSGGLSSDSTVLG